MGRVIHSVTSTSYMGCNSTSKLGRKVAALMSQTLNYLKEFDINIPNTENMYASAEAYLVQLLKNESELQSLDNLLAIPPQ